MAVFCFGDTAFEIIQSAAGIDLPCDGDHEHTDNCFVYGFHDIRRTFATENVSQLSASELQALMRHQDWKTTQRYINMAKQLIGNSVDKLYVPEFLKKKRG